MPKEVGRAWFPLVRRQSRTCWLTWPRSPYLLSYMFGKAIIFELMLLLFAWLAAWLFSIPLWGEDKWNWIGAAVGITSTLPMVSMFFWLLQSKWEPNRKICQMMDEAVLPLFKDFTILQIALLSIAAGISEEVLFRAVIQGGLQSSLHLNQVMT